MKPVKVEENISFDQEKKIHNRDMTIRKNNIRRVVDMFDHTEEDIKKIHYNFDELNQSPTSKEMNQISHEYMINDRLILNNEFISEHGDKSLIISTIKPKTQKAQIACIAGS